MRLTEFRLNRWDFAQTHSLLLPDEYDRIHLDLAPFWALPRAEMRRRVREAMNLNETFVLVVENGNVSVEVSLMISIVSRMVTGS